MSERLATIMREEFTSALLKQIEARAKAAGKSSEEIAAIVKANVDSAINLTVLRHDERSAIVLFEEAYLIGGLQNLALPLGKETNWTGDAPSLLSEQSVPFESTVTLKRANEASGEAEIGWVNTFSAEHLKEQVLSVVRSQLEANQAISKEKREEILAAVAKSELSRVDTGNAIVGLADGWVRSLHYLKRVRSTPSGEPVETREKSIRIDVTR